MKHKLFLFIFLLMIAKSFYGQELTLYEKHLYVNGSDTMPYRLLLPDNYNSSKKYSLILFLHGAGERGNDNEKQLVHGAKLFLREEVRKSYPAIVVFPQCGEDSYWSNVKINRNVSASHKFIFQERGEPTIAMVLVQQLLEKIIADYSVQKDQIYVGGLSMGGMGTFEIVRRNPRLFAAAFPICGGAHPATARKLKNTGWWVFHGAKDDVVPPVYSQVMVDALKKKKASVRYTFYPDANHNSWDPAFAEKDLLPWLFAQKRKY
ncbi:MAG: prolyl oligopeptidase family serine peptidase [Chitinophagaceae bacterium]